ncbi:type I restriction endonuclease subunit R [Rhodopirellula europaea]|uniref:Type I restriction enzyme endonuclease subunit n=1 Tax=Rhodopirellula europaea 6C TaxID=1263867 RepID=M2AUH8_9BACT|nr:type I restriction endonuclease subunit R [Rhodopirellula europaea]EMB13664.1 type I site-specific restriction-modification system, R (restriction) subunit [Rhodopirellula europaea 6C]
MSFNEANTVEQMILDACQALGWQFVSGPQLPRQSADVFVESKLRDALIRLNPEIAAQPDRADEVIYKLRAIPLAVQNDGLVRSNEALAEWMRNDKTMPFGARGEHTTVRLIDFDDLANNELIVCNQWTYKVGKLEKRFDIVLLINGLPVVVGEAKTPVRPAVTWVDGASQIHDDYEQSVPAMFVPNIFSFASDGRAYRYGSIRMPLTIWGPWRLDSQPGQPGGVHEKPEDFAKSGLPKTDAAFEKGSLADVRKTVESMLRPKVVLDILQNFTVFATDKKHRRIKIICRYQQYEGTNLIVQRVIDGRIKKGLIWHFQGSGKSLLMVFTAQKLRMHPKLGNPTVLIVVDRIDLDTQITATFNAADVPNMIKAESRSELQQLLAKDVRKIIITTIHKFGEADGELNARDNIIALVDEAHRTQEGDLGRKMREALPNTFLFGLTGTPINRADKNTFYAFGADEDKSGYLTRYSFQESIRDGATLPLHFEAPDVKLRIDQAAIDEAYAKITGELSEQDRDDLGKRAAKMAVLVKSPERVDGICEHIVNHFQAKVDPNGFKGMVVTFDRQCCDLYKKAIDRITEDPDMSAVVMSVNSGETQYDDYRLDRDAEEKLLDRFRDPADPLKLLIVTSKLLTGFDAPILQAQYLDKPMKDHNLLQTICRTNRVADGKSHGLIVDYIGIFDDVAKALAFDEKAVQSVITNLDELKAELPEKVKVCLAFFPNVDRTLGGYEGLLLAQDCLPDNETRDKFAAEFSVLARLWEALSPDACLSPHETDYRWLGQVYESVKPASGNGRLLWHALGAKTIELIHDNTHLEGVSDDLDALVMDADLIEAVEEAKGRARKIALQLIARLRKHGGDPKFVDLGERLEKLKERHDQGLDDSRKFLKEILRLAQDVVQAEKATPPEVVQDQGKAALTELFEEIRNDKTPIVVEKIVADIDDIVRIVRFDGWQDVSAGQREVKKALRRTLLKYKLHGDQELFDRAYGYIEQYY